MIQNGDFDKIANAIADTVIEDQERVMNMLDKSAMAVTNYPSGFSIYTILDSELRTLVYEAYKLGKAGL